MCIRDRDKYIHSMQDSQDNTFPIPATGGTDPNAAAGPVPAPDNQGLGFTPAPAPTGGDNGQIPANDSGQTPVAPDWTNQASADAAALPPGSDNFSINTPPSPSSGVAADLPLSPSPAPDTGVAIDPNASNPVNTDSGIPVSYTHLDVYKRQVLCRFEPRFR